MWWQVFPLGFVGAEPAQLRGEDDVAHRLGHVTEWLGYAVELGASGLALGPVFSSETHGYDTVDYFRIDARLGDDADFDDLVQAAHARGMRVLLDGVFNHVGRGFPAFQSVLVDGPAVATATWFHLTWPPDAGPGTEPSYRDFEGHHALVALNHEEQAVEDLVVDVMTHWLRRGVDGWRLDAAYAVPTGFWAKVLPRVRAEFPEVYVVGEVIHGDYVAAVRGGGLDAVTQYELWKAIWSSLNDRNFYELAAALDRHNALLDTFAPLTFVGNHDVTRLATKLRDADLVAHALTVLLTVGGTPSIYYGDEQAFRGLKEDRIGGDDAIRPAFPARPEDLAPWGSQTYRLHQELIGLRRRHPWLHGARTRMLTLTNRGVVYASEAEDGGDRLVVALNIDDVLLDFPLPHRSRVIAGNGVVEGGQGSEVVLPPAGWAVLEPTD